MGELTHSHDQVIRWPKGTLAQVDNEVEEIIERSLLDRSPHIALEYAESLVATGHLRGIQLMKLFYRLDEEWNKFKMGEPIEDAIFKATGIPLRKFEDYRDIYKYILKDHSELSTKPIGGLLAILAAAREGTFEDEHWKELEKAHDKAAMVAIRRRVRGVATKGHARLVIVWTRDGNLRARRGDGEYQECGFLPRQTGNDVVDDAVDRLIRSAGVMKI